MNDHYYEFRMVDEQDGTEITMKIPGQATAGELLQQLEYFMLSAGYHPETVKEMFEEIRQ